MKFRTLYARCHSIDCVTGMILGRDVLPDDMRISETSSALPGPGDSGREPGWSAVDPDSTLRIPARLAASSKAGGQVPSVRRTVDLVWRRVRSRSAAVASGFTGTQAAVERQARRAITESVAGSGAKAIRSMRRMPRALRAAAKLSTRCRRSSCVTVPALVAMAKAPSPARHRFSRKVAPTSGLTSNYRAPAQSRRIGPTV
jgi:hypothetical protein